MTITLLLDTSVAVPLVVAYHAAHEVVNRRVGTRRPALAGHALYETYSVLTRLPGDARLAPGDAEELIRDRFAQVDEPTRSPFQLMGDLARGGVAGGAVYDGLVALAALQRPRALLLSRDERAIATYRRLGVRFELI